jgi:SAM-dependent methyltransferase
MAHPEQQQFFLHVKRLFPERFTGCRVLDIGSLDINGNNRYLFSNYQYIGIDVAKGKNVDIVSLGHEYTSDTPFDIVISAECFEHDMYWDKTIQNCIELTKKGGLFTFSAATTGRHEHGTKRTTPQDSPFTHDMFNDYYRNLTQEDVEGIPGFLDNFDEHEFKFNLNTKDIYFWGIKKG